VLHRLTSFLDEDFWFMFPLAHDWKADSYHRHDIMGTPASFVTESLKLHFLALFLFGQAAIPIVITI
jgi:hypothetical protein